MWRNPIGAIFQILANTEKIMTAQDDEKQAIADLTTAVTAENSQIDALVSQLAASAKATGMDDATVEGFVSQIKGLTAGINDKLAQFQTAPAPTSAPEPGPTGP